jgi:hypothetical protein
MALLSSQTRWPKLALHSIARFSHPFSHPQIFTFPNSHIPPFPNLQISTFPNLQISTFSNLQIFKSPNLQISKSLFSLFLRVQYFFQFKHFVTILGCLDEIELFGTFLHLLFHFFDCFFQFRAAHVFNDRISCNIAVFNT